MGGTFDPIHLAHLIVAEEVRSALHLDTMVFIPAGQPPHKGGIAHAEVHHRLKMVELALASNPHFTISRVEIDRPGPSYLVDTLRTLHEQWGPESELYFVVGWDSLEYFHAWHNASGILAQLRKLVAVHRPGYRENREYMRLLDVRLPGMMERLKVVEAPQLDISSTELRRRIAEGRPIRYQVPEDVERYIGEHNLYSASLPHKEG